MNMNLSPCLRLSVRLVFRGRVSALFPALLLLRFRNAPTPKPRCFPLCYCCAAAARRPAAGRASAAAPSVSARCIRNAGLPTTPRMNADMR